MEAILKNVHHLAFLRGHTSNIKKHTFSHLNAKFVACITFCTILVKNYFYPLYYWARSGALARSVQGSSLHRQVTVHTFIILKDMSYDMTSNITTWPTISRHDIIFSHKKGYDKTECRMTVSVWRKWRERKFSRNCQTIYFHLSFRPSCRTCMNFRVCHGFSRQRSTHSRHFREDNGGHLCFGFAIFVTVCTCMRTRIWWRPFSKCRLFLSARQHLAPQVHIWPSELKQKCWQMSILRRFGFSSDRFWTFEDIFHPNLSFSLNFSADLTGDF